MKWATLGKAHFNTDLIQAFSWSGGKLQVWWHGEPEGPEFYEDPDRVMYNRLCLALGIAPVEGAADGEG